VSEESIATLFVVVVVVVVVVIGGGGGGGGRWFKLETETEQLTCPCPQHYVQTVQSKDRPAVFYSPFRTLHPHAFSCVTFYVHFCSIDM
jgi:hypothetical protein